MWAASQQRFLLIYAYVMAPHIYAAHSLPVHREAALQRGLLHGQVTSDF